MSKRLIRIFASMVLDALPRLLNQEIHVVLYTGQTFFGRLESSTALDLCLYDLRSHMHQINLADIEEIILDQPGSRLTNPA